MRSRASTGTSTTELMYKQSSVPVYTMAQVAKHNNPCDAWLVVDGLVYDVSKWLNHHPGGAKTLLRFAGKDATDEMLAFHPEWVSEKKLPFFKIGVVSDPPKPTSLQREFRALHSKFESNGWFQPDLIYYAKKLVLYGILFLTSISLVLFTRSDACHLLGAWMMAIFWWQMAFVGHDAGHMSVTYSRDMDYKFGLVIANLLTGISVGWWKSTHNVHHAVPNTLNHDPDIAHLPVLAVSNKFFQSPFHSYHNFNLNFGFLARRVFVPYQHYLYYPIMAAARFNLYLQSLVHMVTTSDPFKTLELVSELLFFVWYISLLTRLNSGWMMFWYVLISHGLSGILEVQITLSHFSKPVIDERETTKPNDPSGSSQYGGDFYTRNVLASLDVTCSEWMDWAHGGLQFQTIHHMYPRLHRSKLRAARVHVIALCKKYNLPFEEVSFWDANRQVLATLRKSALESKEWNPMIGESFSAVG